MLKLHLKSIFAVSIIFTSISVTAETEISLADEYQGTRFTNNGSITKIKLSNLIPDKTYQVSTTRSLINIVGPNINKPAVPTTLQPQSPEESSGLMGNSDYVAALNISNNNCQMVVSEFLDEFSSADTEIEIKKIISSKDERLNLKGSFDDKFNVLKKEANDNAPDGTEITDTYLNQKAKESFKDNYKDSKELFSSEYCIKAIKEASDELEKSTMVVVIGDVSENETINVAVTRLKANNTPAKTWNWSYVGVAEGVWKSAITFLFAFDNARDETYTLMPVEVNNETRYYVRDITTDSTWTPKPTLMFTYFPKDWDNDIGVSGGFNADLNKPGAVVGVSKIFGDGIILTGGLGIFETQKLSGRYTDYENESSLFLESDATVLAENVELLQENIDPNSLTVETYEMSFFLSLGYVID